MKLSMQMSIYVPWPLILENDECGFRESEYYAGLSKESLLF